MAESRRPRRLATLHRWIGLTLAPVYVVIAVTGGILALKPLLVPPPVAVAPIDPVRVIDVLRTVDADGRARGASIEDDRHTVTIDRGEDGLASYDLATGAPVRTPPQAAPDLFDRVRHVHADLWFGAVGLVGLATVAMLGLVSVGPLLARPGRRPGSARGWHTLAGWLLWPVLLMLPLSVVLMKIHRKIPMGREPDVPLAMLLVQAERGADLAHLRGIGRLRGGTALLVADADRPAVRYVVRPEGVVPLDSRVSSLGHALHEGTWAGPWSAALNLLGAIGMLVLVGTGLASWWRRLRPRRSAAPGAWTTRTAGRPGTTPRSW